MSLSNSNSSMDAWSPEPELREQPPRRTAPLEENYPDLNQPSKLLLFGSGGLLLVAGLVLFLVSISHGQYLLVVLGILLALGGAVLVGLYPAKVRSHEARIEHLLTYGVPVIARILHADNLTGDSTFGRSIKYQVVTIGGDIVHRTVNVDERRLPKRVPGDATALFDPNTGDVELYCALPRRAIVRPVAPAQAAKSPSAAPRSTQPAATGGVYAGAAAAAPAPEVFPGTMGTLDAGAAPVRPVAPAPDPEPVAPPVVKEKREKKPASPSGLPWE